MTRPVLRLVLLLTGLAMVAIGLNTALGGMATLGWQFSPSAIAVAEPVDFARHDNNARFFAGVFTAFGLLMAAGAVALERCRPAIIAFLLALTVGGLFRLAQGGYSPLTDSDLLPSLLGEIVLAPALALWLWKKA